MSKPVHQGATRAGGCTKRMSREPRVIAKQAGAVSSLTNPAVPGDPGNRIKAAAPPGAPTAGNMGCMD